MASVSSFRSDPTVFGTFLVAPPSDPPPQNSPPLQKKKKSYAFKAFKVVP